MARCCEEIRAAIGHRKLARLAELAPEHVTLGGGRRVTVNYEVMQAEDEPSKPPWIESRLQDFFGSSQTPRILEGRVRARASSARAERPRRAGDDRFGRLLGANVPRGSQRADAALPAALLAG